MRWPWVSRERYDLLLRLYDDTTMRWSRMERDFNTDRARYDALLEKYHALKVQGATVTETRQPVEAKEPDAVQWAINEKAGNNHALRLHLTGYAAKERLNNVPDEEIVSRLTKWHSETDD